MTKNTEWKDNMIQFPRLIAEAEAVGIWANAGSSMRWGEMCCAMDIRTDDAMVIVERAQGVWEEYKAALQRTEADWYAKTLREIFEITDETDREDLWVDMRRVEDKIVEVLKRFGREVSDA